MDRCVYYSSFLWCLWLMNNSESSDLEISLQKKNRQSENKEKYNFKNSYHILLYFLRYFLLSAYTPMYTPQFIVHAALYLKQQYIALFIFINLFSVSVEQCSFNNASFFLHENQIAPSGLLLIATSSNFEKNSPRGMEEDYCINI